MARLFETVRAHTDTLDALVHCAGLLHDAETGLSPEKRVEDVNLAALQRVAHQPLQQRAQVALPLGGV